MGFLCSPNGIESLDENHATRAYYLAFDNNSPACIFAYLVVDRWASARWRAHL
jgi:hypothetical protein